VKLVSLGVLLALAASPALAQPPPPPDALPAILHLQLDQHPAWRAYKDALAQTRAEGSHQAAETARLNGLTTPERLDALRQQLKSRAADFERQADATEAFYAVLSPEQRRIFDDVTRAPVPPAPLHAYVQRSSPPTGPQVLKTPPAGSPLPAPTTTPSP
jgi:hypothetical protein